MDSGSTVVIPNIPLDARFARHPLITGAPFIRFYASVPLRHRDGYVLGTLCVTDVAPHHFSSEQVTVLQLLADLVMSFLEAWHWAGFTDPVTALPNRQRLIRDLQRLASIGNRTPQRLILIDCIDMPRAYELARSIGMGPVERLLKHVTTLLPLRLRQGADDIIYTVATERFAILTPDNSPLNAASVAESLAGIWAQASLSPLPALPARSPLRL